MGVRKIKGPDTFSAVQAFKNLTMGQHKDRNAQFENIARLKAQYLDSLNPLLSIDTKKKEMLGNFHRDGVTEAVEPTTVNDHDFVSASDGKVRLGLKIRICHYPPYCSKCNPIEHRVFPHVTRACQGVPLETIETAKHYIEKTETIGRQGVDRLEAASVGF